MFYLIGLGLGDCKDITVKGFEIIKKCNRVYLEAYTSILTQGKDELEKFYGREVLIADRGLVEEGADAILENSDSEDVALLVVGDPLGATTHTDLILRAKEKGIRTQVVHNASILTAVGCCGLQLYSFGETVSIPFWTETWKPDSYYDKIVMNYENKLHTLCLLDIKVKEPTLESLTKKKIEYMPPRFMTVREAARQLLEIAARNQNNCAVNDKTLCVGLSKVGSDEQRIVWCSLKEMSEYDLGPPLHSLIIIGPHLHPLECEYLEYFRLS